MTHPSHLPEPPPPEVQAAGALLRFLARGDRQAPRDLSVAVNGLVTTRSTYRLLLDQFVLVLERLSGGEKLEILQKALHSPEIDPPELDLAGLDIEKVWSALFEFAVQASAHAASRDDVVERRETVTAALPALLDWMAERWTLEAAERKSEREKRLDELDRQRRDTPLPLGIPFDVEPLRVLLSRGESLILVGWQNLLEWYRTEVLNHLLKETRVGILHLACGSQKEQAGGRWIRVPEAQWAEAGETASGIPTLLTRHVVQRLTGPVDLVVVDDLVRLAAAKRRQNAAAACNQAHRRLKTTCRALGAALIAFVPCDSRDPPDLGGVTWETVRTHATLRPLWVAGPDEDGAGLPIALGRGTIIRRVPETRLRGASPLILPEGT